MSDAVKLSRPGITALAVISLVFGILSLLVFAHIFGATAIVCGSIAGANRRAMGWVGMSLGIIAIVLWVIQLCMLLND